MSSIDPLPLAHRIADELLTQGDLAVAAEVFAPACRHHGLDGSPMTTADWLTWVVALRRIVTDLSVLVDGALADDDHVALRLRFRGTLAPPRQSDAGGARVQWVAIAWLRSGVDGRTVEHWLFGAWPDAVRRIAVDLPPGVGAR
jgi:SnoaL-like polyketide cyclase